MVHIITRDYVRSRQKCITGHMCVGVCVCKNGSSERVPSQRAASRAWIARKITSAGDKSHVSEQKYSHGPRARLHVTRGSRLESKLRFLRNAHLAIALHRRPRMETRSPRSSRNYSPKERRTAKRSFRELFSNTSRDSQNRVRMN